MTVNQTIMHGDILGVLVKEQSAKGTAATLEATDGIDLISASFNIEQTPIELPSIREVYDARGIIMGKVCYKFSLEVAMGGPPDPDTSALAEPSWGRLFEAAGWVHAATGTPIDTHTYTLYPGGAQTLLTIGFYVRAMSGAASPVDIYQAEDCVLALQSIECAPDAQIIAKFEGMGVFSPPTAGALVSATGVFDDDGAAGTNVTFTVGGDSRISENITFEFPYEVVSRDRVTAEYGVEGFFLKKDPSKSTKIMHSVEMNQVGTYDHITNMLDGVEGALVWEWDTKGGANLEMTAAAAQAGEFEIEMGDPMMLKQTLYIKGSDLALAVTYP